MCKAVINYFDRDDSKKTYFHAISVGNGAQARFVRRLAAGRPVYATLLVLIARPTCFVKLQNIYSNGAEFRSENSLWS